MTLIRKNRAGSSGHSVWKRPPGPGDPGEHAEPALYEWPEDGAVVDVAPEHVQDLMRIPDGGFTEVPPDPEEAYLIDNGGFAGAEGLDIQRAEPPARRRRVRE